MNTDYFFSVLDLYHPLSDDFKKFLRDALIPLSVPARHILLDVPRVASHVYFLQEGFAVSYTLSAAGKITEGFWKPGQLILSFESFFEQKPSLEVIQLVTSSELLGVSYEAVNEALLRFPEAQVLYRVMLNKHYLHVRKRLRDIKFSNHAAQYSKLRQIFPGLELIVSQRTIATYLGIAPQSLARIKRRRDVGSR